MNIEKKDKEFIITEPDCTITLAIESDDMELWCSIEPKQPGIKFSYTDFKSLVKEELKLNGHRERESIKNVLAQAKLGKAVKNAVIMKGILPEDGCDGKLEFFFQPTIDEPKIDKDDPNFQIDYHNLYLFENVKKGDAIAKIHQPQKGVAGSTLLGEPFPAKTGEPLKLSFGEGVRIGTDINPGEVKEKIYSKIDGRIEWNEQACLISVTNKYLVKEVNRETGNIDFIGNVEVNGEVINGFDIKTGGDLFIKGNIESSQIECGGDLTFAGITGNETATIKCAGLITAKFIDGTDVESMGDILVNNEIVDSNIKTRGKVMLEKKAIIGGSIFALRGIESKDIGSDLGVKTILSAGKCFMSEEQIGKVNQKIEDNKNRLEEISEYMNPLIANPALIKRLNKEEKVKLRESAGEFAALNREQEELPKKIEEIKEEVKKKSNPVINVWGILHRGVDIQLGHTFKQFTEDIKQGMSIVENSRKKDLRFIPMIQLSENAKLAEKQIARAEIAAESV